MGIFPSVRGENKKYLKPPPSIAWYRPKMGSRECSWVRGTRTRKNTPRNSNRVSCGLPNETTTQCYLPSNSSLWSKASSKVWNPDGWSVLSQGWMDLTQGIRTTAKKTGGNISRKHLSWKFYLRCLGDWFHWWLRFTKQILIFIECVKCVTIFMAVRSAWFPSFCEEYDLSKCQSRDRHWKYQKRTSIALFYIHHAIAVPTSTLIQNMPSWRFKFHFGMYFAISQGSKAPVLWTHSIFWGIDLYTHEERPVLSP